MTQPNTISGGQTRQRMIRTSHLPKLYRDAANILVQNGEIELRDDAATHLESGSA